MAFDDGLAERVRELLADTSGVVEKRMFGGLAFLINGHMCCGIVGSELMLRVGPKQYDEVLSIPYVRQMDFTGRPMKGFVFISEKGFEEEAQLNEWILRSLMFVHTLPEKA
jgi:TfoX/Sxy family transcriptional regulator of competence genes